MNRQDAVKALRAAGKDKEVRDLIADAVGRAAAQYADIANDTRLSDQGKVHHLAGAYHRANGELTRELERRARATVTVDRDDAATIFGTKGLSGDQASLIISQRDAADRVANAGGREELRELLVRATRTGDEVLARAVVERAVRDQDDQIVNLFIEDRPETDAALNRLWNAQRAEVNTLGFNVELMGLKPDELKGMDDDAIAEVARGPEPAPSEPVSAGFGGESPW